MHTYVCMYVYKHTHTNKHKLSLSHTHTHMHCTAVRPLWTVRLSPRISLSNTHAHAPRLVPHTLAPSHPLQRALVSFGKGFFSRGNKRSLQTFPLMPTSRPQPDLISPALAFNRHLFPPSSLCPTNSLARVRASSWNVWEKIGGDASGGQRRRGKFVEKK